MRFQRKKDKLHFEGKLFVSGPAKTKTNKQTTRMNKDHNP
jgi:hypothetical protein